MFTATNPRRSTRVPQPRDFHGYVSSDQAFGDDDDPESDVISVPSYDPSYKEKQLRLRWNAGLYESLKADQTNWAGELICGLCGNVIELDSKGREVYNPPDKYKNHTKPHIDHYSKDWRFRLEDLYNTNFKSEQEFMDAAVKSYNAKPLHIVHKECNLKKNKS